MKFVNYDQCTFFFFFAVLLGKTINDDAPKSLPLQSILPSKIALYTKTSMVMAMIPLLNRLETRT